MQESESGARDGYEEARRCLRCKSVKLFQDFPKHKRRASEYKRVCNDCEHEKWIERHRRVAAQREISQEQREEREERKRISWERKAALLQAYEQQSQERENWYSEQLDHWCRCCKQVLPATEFGSVSSLDGFTLRAYCSYCHAAGHEQRYLPCCVCGRQIARCDFLTQYDGYTLCCNGTALSLCCKECESAFHALSEQQKALSIHSCCQRTFPAGQVIYAEVDPETNEIRYIGRTSNPRRRHSQHMSDTSPIIAQWGPEKRAWYTRSNWMYTLAQKGLAPSMHILKPIELSPLVVEWELRYIWHGIQQGWSLLNSEMMDDRLVARVRASPLNFLEAPFETLLEHKFFMPHELPAFIRRWYGSEYLQE